MTEYRDAKEEQKRKAVLLYQSGMGIREVAKETKLAYTTVQRTLVRSGVQRRPPGGTQEQREERAKRARAHKERKIVP